MSEVLIVGGGLAGAALATKLARAGRQVILIEREVAPHHKMCGEFLSGEAILYLRALGIDLAGLGAAAIDTVRFAGEGGVAERKLPFPAMSLSRRVLDEALLARAAEAGATILRGQAVQGLERDGAGWKARLSLSPALREREGPAVSLTAHSSSGGEGVINASTVFLATGKHDLRGWKRPSGKQNDLVAFKMHWRLSPDQATKLQGAVELFLFPGGYGGLEPVEEGGANLCFLIRRRELERQGGKWEAVLESLRQSCPLLATRLQGAQPLWDKPLAIAAIPYGHVRRESADGLWRLGDQAVVIPSFSGDGMAIALHSAHLAASTYLTGGTADGYQRRLASDVGRQVGLATMISRALVDPGGQALCGLAAGWLPWTIGAAARATRISDKALAA